jgi:hypothetical protein
VKVDTFDDDSLFSHKTIQLGSKSIETPTKAIQIGETTKNDQILDDVRGANEIYFSIDPGKLAKAQQEFKPRFKQNIGQALNKTDDDEFNFVFAQFGSERKFDDDNLHFLLDTIYSTSDFITVPLMTDLVSAIEEDGDGTDSIYFDTYKENVKRFIETAEQINSKPIMGTLPQLPWGLTNEIVELYLDKGIRAFCFDFNGRTVTAQFQLSNMVVPLLREIGRRKLQEEVFFYCLNANRGRGSSETDYVPARDFISLGFGFDIVGDKHMALPKPPDFYEKIDESRPEIRLFNKDEYYYKNHDYDGDLLDQIPNKTGLDREKIASNPGDYHRRKFETLLNGEQQALETIDLRPAIDENRAIEHIEPKSGVDVGVISSLESSKEAFENERQQQRLNDIW